jgi:hypothetical protein
MSKPQAEVTCFFPQTWPPGKVTNGGLSWSGPENLQPQVTENGFIIDGAYDILADLHSRLVRLDCRIGVVESCTGGLLGSLLTSLAGSSAYFQGGWLTYSKEAKIQLAGVSPETLELYGAVSLETAEEMAQGGRGRTEPQPLPEYHRYRRSWRGYGGKTPWHGLLWISYKGRPPIIGADRDGGILWESTGNQDEIRLLCSIFIA